MRTRYASGQLSVNHEERSVRTVSIRLEALGMVSAVSACAMFYHEIKGALLGERLGKKIACRWSYLSYDLVSDIAVAAAVVALLSIHVSLYWQL